MMCMLRGVCGRVYGVFVSLCVNGVCMYVCMVCDCHNMHVKVREQWERI